MSRARPCRLPPSSATAWTTTATAWWTKATMPAAVSVHWTINLVRPATAAWTSTSASTICTGATAGTPWSASGAGMRTPNSATVWTTTATTRPTRIGQQSWCSCAWLALVSARCPASRFVIRAALARFATLWLVSLRPKPATTSTTTATAWSTRAILKAAAPAVIPMSASVTSACGSVTMAGSSASAMSDLRTPSFATTSTTTATAWWTKATMPAAVSVHWTINLVRPATAAWTSTSASTICTGATAGTPWSASGAGMRTPNSATVWTTTATARWMKTGRIWADSAGMVSASAGLGDG